MRCSRVFRPQVLIVVGFLAATPSLAGEDVPDATAPKEAPLHEVAPAVPEKPVTPEKVPSCDSPEMAEHAMSSFDASDGAQSLNVSAVAIHDAAAIDPASVLATRLDRGAPPGDGVQVAVHCKAHIELNTGHTMSQVFRVDVMPATGQQKIISTPIYDADFDVPELAAAPPQPEAAPSSNAAAGLPPRKPLPMGSQLKSKQAAGGPTAPIAKQRELPAGTVLCTSEADIGRFLFAQKLGLTCFRLVRPAAFVVANRKAAGYQQVRLTGGEHRGMTGWTAILVSVRQP